MLAGLIAKLNFVTLALLVLAIAGGGAGYYYYTQNQKLAKNPNLVAQEETKRLVSAVGQLIELPKEEPTIATVADKSKLKDQPFFAKVENGDKVLIFTKAKKAYLYRPSTNKVIEVAPVSLGASQEQKVTVALYNGTTTVGLTKTIEEKLEGKISTIDVALREDANKNDYQKTLVIDLSGKNSQLAKQIADELSGEVGNLPSGETKPQTDILVILGK